jgi:peptidoglycan/LPS O-acetylase OafA/YrhL
VKTSTKPDTILTLQALRGIAAIMVVIHHSIGYWYVNVLGQSTGWFVNGSYGVDIFFIISGFIMPLSIRRLSSSAETASVFLKRRLERVVPLYWIWTTSKVAFHFLGRSREPFGPPWHVVASYFFLPAISSTGEKNPLLTVGWTLQMEMMFYLLIAFSLWMGWRLRVFMPITLGLLASLYFVSPLDRTALDLSRHPLYLEFLCGLVLAYLFNQRRLKIPAPVAGIVLVSSFILLMTSYAGYLRGVLAFLIVASGLALEPFIRSYIPRLLLFLGDASYSIYLSHVTFVKYAVKAYVLFPTYHGPLLAAAVGLLLGCTAGAITYVCIEHPINNYFKVRRRVAIPA